MANDYSVEFNDSVLDLEGWKNPRFEGSKLTGNSINTFTQGDVTYGKNPVIENKVVALYFGTTIIGGDSGIDGAEEAAYVKLIGHSYVSIDKILLIDINTDEVELIDRQNTGKEAFKRFVDKDLPEGSIINFKLLDKSIDNALKLKHSVKFNRGSLQRIYNYTANNNGYEDGVFGGYNIRNNIGDVYTGSLQGPGLFGYGMTAPASRSLFTTNSISFVEQFPSELSIYSGDVNLTTLGNELAPITSSVDANFPAALAEIAVDTTPTIR